MIFSPIAWVRNVEVFSFGYLYGVFAIFLMVIIVSSFCAIRIYENENQSGLNWVAFNEKDYIMMIGIAFF